MRNQGEVLQKQGRLGSGGARSRGAQRKCSCLALPFLCTLRYALDLILATRFA